MKEEFAPSDLVVLEMLEGNDWRYIRTYYARAKYLLNKTQHRGYLLYRERDGHPLNRKSVRLR
ncbi:hypothetical protein [Vibrio sp. 10N.261.46.A3]|uniref:hypothetical protein n=1 Tax=Vibrio sp. 10N.261.46.A3 TaxID=3229658 RepID=UPI00354DE68A